MPTYPFFLSVESDEEFDVYEKIAEKILNKKVIVDYNESKMKKFVSRIVIG